MQLEIKSPELEALLVKRLQDSGSERIEEVLLRALSASPLPKQGSLESGHRQPGRMSLPALFADSPFKGIDLRLERDEDTGRDLRL